MYDYLMNTNKSRRNFISCLSLLCQSIYPNWIFIHVEGYQSTISSTHLKDYVEVFTLFTRLIWSVKKKYFILLFT